MSVKNFFLNILEQNFPQRKFHEKKFIKKLFSTRGIDLFIFFLKFFCLLHYDVIMYPNVTAYTTGEPKL